LRGEFYPIDQGGLASQKNYREEKPFRKSNGRIIPPKIRGGIGK
jgi:hypothetical protein